MAKERVINVLQIDKSTKKQINISNHFYLYAAGFLLIHICYSNSGSV